MHLRRDVVLPPTWSDPFHNGNQIGQIRLSQDGPGRIILLTLFIADSSEKLEVLSTGSFSQTYIPSPFRFRPFWTTAGPVTDHKTLCQGASFLGGERTDVPSAFHLGTATPVAPDSDQEMAAFEERYTIPAQNVHLILDSIKKPTRRTLQVRFARNNHRVPDPNVPVAITTAFNGYDVDSFLLPEEFSFSGLGHKKKKPNLRSASKGVVRALVREQLSSIVGKDMAKATIRTAGRALGGGKKKKQGQRKYNAAPRDKPGSAENIRSFYRGNSLVLGKASNDWLNCFLNPFSGRVKKVGVPRPGSQPSLKITGFLRGTGYIGTNGFGFVYAMPTLANDRCAAAVSVADYAGTQIAQFNNNHPVNTQTVDTNRGLYSPYPVYMTNLPFTSAQLDDAAYTHSGRIVSCSLRMQYTGTELNRSGQYYAIVDPDFAPITGLSHSISVNGSGYDVATASARDACEIQPVTRNGDMRIVYTPPDNRMFDYSRQEASTLRKNYPFCQGQAQADNATSQGQAAIMITGIPGESFYFEMVTHCEYMTHSFQSQLTESVSDVVGFDSLACVLNRAQREVAADVHCNIRKAIKQELRKERIVFKEY